MLLGPPLSLSGIRRENFFVAAPIIERKRPCQERAAEKSRTHRKSMIFGVVEISLDAGQQRGLVVSNATGAGLRYTNRCRSPCTAPRTPRPSVSVGRSRCLRRSAGAAQPGTRPRRRCACAGLLAPHPVAVNAVRGSLPAPGAPASMLHGRGQPARATRPARTSCSTRTIPVDWYPWGDEAFARARAEDKPVLLSIGYSACHWCHVMERESLREPGDRAR